MADIYGFFNNFDSLERKSQQVSRMKDHVGYDLLTEYHDEITGSLLCQTSWESIADQPQSVPCVLDGEIYNRDELLPFVTDDKQSPMTDAELIYLLYRKKIKGFPGIINGIFAFAIVDRDAGKLVIARDHLGSRSLYFAQVGQTVYFATRIKTLLKAGVDATLSEQSIYSYLCSVSLTPPQTMFKSVEAVRPATMLSFDRNNNRQEQRYWDIAETTEDRNKSFAEFSDEIKSLIINSVKIRADKGGQIGSIVSGGIDSSVVTSVLCDSLSKPERLPVFSIAFAEKKFSDASLQELMYQAFPVDHHQSQIGPDQYWSLLGKAMSVLDAPVNDDAMVGMYRVFELARENGCSALFEGEAADELFFTTHVHSERQFLKLKKAVPSFSQSLLGKTFTTSPIGGGITKKIRRQLFRLGVSDTDRRLMILPSYYHTGIPIMKKP